MEVRSKVIYTNCKSIIQVRLIVAASTDVDTSGEAVLTRLPYFQALYDLPGPGTVNPNYDLGILGQNAVLRSMPHSLFKVEANLSNLWKCVGQQSESQNPYYFRGPVGFGIPVGQ